MKKYFLLSLLIPVCVLAMTEEEKQKFWFKSPEMTLYHKRNRGNSAAAVLKKAAFKIPSPRKAPIAKFVTGGKIAKAGKTEYIKEPFVPRIKGGYVFGDLKSFLPESLNAAFVEGMEQFGRVIPGFDDDYCILAGVESRTSSPVRIPRNAEYESVIKGFYPCGEGAGYAGGITSAAMDGLAVAEAIAKKYHP